MKLSKIASLLNSINLIQKINDLIDVARSPLKRSTAYVIGDVVHVYTLPSNLYLECTQAGTTSNFALSLSTTPNTTLTDGTVKWIVRDKNDIIRKSGAASKGSANVPVYFDANGVAQTTKNFNNYLPLAGGTMTGNLILKNDVIERGGTTASNQFPWLHILLDKNNHRISGVYQEYQTNNSMSISLLAYNPTTIDNNFTKLSIGYDLSGVPKTYAPNPDKSSNDNNIATTKFVKDNLADYYPKTGGTLNGNIIFGLADGIINRTNKTGRMIVRGGGSAHEDGSSVYLFGNEHPTNAGWFQIFAHNGTQAKALTGKPDGSLLWANNDIALSKDVLALSGGTMTGTITLNHSNHCFRMSDNTKSLSLLGGSNANSPSGAKGYFYGADATQNAGCFLLQAGDSSGYKQLIGKPNGGLTWDGKEVERLIEKGTNYYKLANGLIVQWGDSGAESGSATKTITLPIAFTTTTYVVQCTDTGSSRYAFGVSNRTKTNFVLDKPTANSACYWFAIGF